ncbi:hypothetical protein MKW94_026141, partial [Papaver nudicaule]|nr:hypothetical protein [Papaver nudicaule]
MSVSQQTAAKYGFIVMVEEGALFGTLSGMTKEILHEFSAEHPMKQLRGLRLVVDTAAARLAWPNVSGLIPAGFEFLMEAVCQSGMLDPTLRDKVLCRALVSCAGDSGFNEAIDLSSKFLADVEFVQEKRLVRKFFAEAMAGKSGDP